jgi:hypothetical protein
MGQLPSDKSVLVRSFEKAAVAYAEFLYCRCCKRPVDGLDTHELAPVGIQIGLER